MVRHFMQSPVFIGALPTVLLSGRGLFQQPKPSDPPPPQPPESDGSEEGGYPWENLSVVGRNGLGAVGPEGGDAGGWVIAEGTPEQVADMPQSFTGQYLCRVLYDDC